MVFFLPYALHKDTSTEESTEATKMPEQEERENLLPRPDSIHSYSSIGNGSATSNTIIESADIETGFGRSIEASMVLSGVSEEITLSWHKVDVYVAPERKRWSLFSKTDKADSPKHILKGVSGVVRPGQLLALMGSSGAGKTTLLDCLTMRRNANLLVHGLVLLNGQVVSPTTMCSLSAYVQQDDLFIGTLTVREHLRFAALLRMHRSISYKQRMRRVQEVIVELGLSKCADTMIGVPGRLKGISGGEMKRLAFASEVLTNPPLMFCDEPTSGLDSFMAQNVISVLKNMAHKGKTIVCTIHQPSSEVFAMFDKILLLAEGKVTFMGDTDKALEFFKDNGYICPSNFNPADYFVHTLAIVPGREETCRKTVTKLHSAYRETLNGKEQDSLDELHEGRLMTSMTDTTMIRQPYRASWWRQFSAVLWRSAKSIIREPMVVRMRMYQTIVIALVLGMLYFNQHLNQNGIQNINGAMFLMLTNMTFQNYFAVINVFCMELPIFLREHWNGMYRTDVYFIAKTIAEVPIYVAIPLVFTTIMYWMVGLYPDPLKYLMTVLIVTLVTHCACSFGYMISCMSKNITMALSLGPPLLTPLLLFGGFFLNLVSIPKYLSWLQYVSWYKYANEALNVNQWKDIIYIECRYPNATGCISTGPMVLEMYNYKEDNMLFDLLMLLVLILVFRVVGYIALYIRARRKL